MLKPIENVTTGANDLMSHSIPSSRSLSILGTDIDANTTVDLDRDANTAIDLDKNKIVSLTILP